MKKYIGITSLIYSVWIPYIEPSVMFERAIFDFVVRVSLDLRNGSEDVQALCLKGFGGPPTIQDFRP